MSCSNPECSGVSASASAGDVKLKRCSKCHSAQYCSRECQAAHWKVHKVQCKQLAQAPAAKRSGAGNARGSVRSMDAALRQATADLSNPNKSAEVQDLLSRAREAVLQSTIHSLAVEFGATEAEAEVWATARPSSPEAGKALVAEPTQVLEAATRWLKTDRPSSVTPEGIYPVAVLVMVEAASRYMLLAPLDEAARVRDAIKQLLEEVEIHYCMQAGHRQLWQVAFATASFAELHALKFSTAEELDSAHHAFELVRAGPRPDKWMINADVPFELRAACARALGRHMAMIGRYTEASGMYSMLLQAARLNAKVAGIGAVHQIAEALNLLHSVEGAAPAEIDREDNGLVDLGPELVKYARDKSRPLEAAVRKEIAEVYMRVGRRARPPLVPGYTRKQAKKALKMIGDALEVTEPLDRFDGVWRWKVAMARAQAMMEMAHVLEGVGDGRGAVAYATDGVALIDSIHCENAELLELLSTGARALRRTGGRAQEVATLLERAIEVGERISPGGIMAFSAQHELLNLMIAAGDMAKVEEMCFDMCRRVHAAPIDVQQKLTLTHFLAGLLQRLPGTKAKLESEGLLYLVGSGGGGGGGGAQKKGKKKKRKRKKKGGARG